MKKFIDKKILISFLVGGFIFGITGAYAATLIASSQVSYNNTQSKLTSSNVQDAIDEIYEKTRATETVVLSLDKDNNITASSMSANAVNLKENSPALTLLANATFNQLSSNYTVTDGEVIFNDHNKVKKVVVKPFQEQVEDKTVNEVCPTYKDTVSCASAAAATAASSRFIRNVGKMNKDGTIDRPYKSAIIYKFYSSVSTGYTFEIGKAFAIKETGSVYRIYNNTNVTNLNTAIQTETGVAGTYTLAQFNAAKTDGDYNQYGKNNSINIPISKGIIVDVSNMDWIYTYCTLSTGSARSNMVVLFSTKTKAEIENEYGSALNYINNVDFDQPGAFVPPTV